MPRRACISYGCPRPAVAGRSRCSRHGRSSSASRSHDSRQNAFRRAVLARFTPGDPCGKCGQPIWDRVDAGHIVPLSLGGTYDPSNGQPEHPKCNRAEGVRLARFFPSK